MPLEIAENQQFFTEKVKFSGAMNSRELKEYIRYLQKNRSDPLRYQSQLYNNYAFPFSSLVMVFIAIPFSFLMGNRGALFGIGIAVGISMIYWGALGIFSSVGATGVHVAAARRLRPAGPVLADLAGPVPEDQDLSRRSRQNRAPGFPNGRGCDKI